MKQSGKYLVHKFLFDIFRTLKMIYSTNHVYFIIVCSFTLLQGILPIIEINIGKYILDNIISVIQINGQTYNIKRIIFWIVIEFAVVFSSTLIENSKKYVQNILGSELVLMVNKKLFTKAASLDATFFENPVFYDQLVKARQGAGQRPLQILNQLFSLLQNFITLFGLAGLLFIFNPVVLVILLITTFPVLNIEMTFSKKIYNIFQSRISEVRKKEYLGSILTDKYFFKELRIFKLMNHILNKYSDISLKHIEQDKLVNRKRILLLTVLHCINLLTYYGIYLYIVYHTVLKTITIGSMSMYIVAIKRIQNSFRSLLQSVSTLYEENLYISNLFSFLEVESNIQNGTIQSINHSTPNDFIVFRNVSFKYPETDRYVLKDINLTIRQGQSIALVGLNGSGKTTLVKLLCRFYDPTEGNIFLDGINIRDLDINLLHKKISTIFQDYVRYNTTVRENIGMGFIEKLNNLQLIIDAAKKSEADEFIKKLPKEYDEELGRLISKGAELSIGQWQKIALARAFFKNGEILILDEPTASLDPETEYEIFQRFKELTKEKTSLLISHRFSTVRMADNIIVLKNGMILEEGTHEELLKKNGEYARLYCLQAESYNVKTDYNKDGRYA